MKELLKTRKLIHFFCLSGIIGLVFYILHIVVGAMNYDGYNWMAQAVSDLTAVNAPSRTIASGLSNVYGLFSITCCSIVCIYMQGKSNKVMRLGIYAFTFMNWISGVGYSIFPLTISGYGETFQDFMHAYIITTMVVLLSIISLVLIVIGGCKEHKKYVSLSVLAGITLVCMCIGGIGIGLVPSAYSGLIERFSVYSAVIFNAILGLYGFIFFDVIDNKKVGD